MPNMNLNDLKVWPHLTIVAVVIALVAGVGVGWYVRHEQTASAKELPNAARIQRVDGQVLLNNSGANTAPTDQNWLAATVNQPFTVGDRIYTRDNAHASLAFTGRNLARLNPNTSLDILSLSDQRTQLALRDGSAVFDVGYLQPSDLFEVATPYGAVDLQQPGLYNVGIDNGNVLVSVLSGLAQVVEVATRLRGETPDRRHFMRGLTQSIGGLGTNNFVTILARSDAPAVHDSPTPLALSVSTTAKKPPTQSGMSDEGVIETFTILHVTPDGFLPPLALALVRDRRGTLLMAQGEEDSQLKIGQEVYLREIDGVCLFTVKSQIQKVQHAFMKLFRRWDTRAFLKSSGGRAPS